MSLGSFLSEGPLLLVLNCLGGHFNTNIMVLKKNNLSGRYIYMLLICPRGYIVWLNYVLRGHYQQLFLNGCMPIKWKSPIQCQWPGVYAQDTACVIQNVHL